MYRSDPQFKDVSTLVFRDKSSSEAMPMGRRACDSRVTHHCWQQLLGCCSLGGWNGDAKRCFSQKPPLQSPSTKP